VAVSFVAAGLCFVVAALVAFEGTYLWRNAPEAGPTVGPWAVVIAAALVVVGVAALALARAEATTRWLVFLALLLPGLAFGVAYWIWVGWLGDAYDLGRAMKIAIIGVYALVFVALWALLVAMGAAAVTRLLSSRRLQD